MTGNWWPVYHVIMLERSRYIGTREHQTHFYGEQKIEHIRKETLLHRRARDNIIQSRKRRRERNVSNPIETRRKVKMCNSCAPEQPPLPSKSIGLRCSILVHSFYSFVLSLFSQHILMLNKYNKNKFFSTNIVQRFVVTRKRHQVI